MTALEAQTGDDSLAAPWARVPLMAGGALLVVIGTIGIFVPLLPSTIFFLLAAAAFGRSSPSAYRWLTTNRYFGSRLRHYREERGATVGTKVTSVASLWAGIGLATWAVGFQPVIMVCLAAIAAGVTVHLLRLKTIHTR